MRKIWQHFITWSHFKKMNTKHQWTVHYLENRYDCLDLIAYLPATTIGELQQNCKCFLHWSLVGIMRGDYWPTRHIIICRPPWYIFIFWQTVNGWTIQRSLMLKLMNLNSGRSSKCYWQTNWHHLMRFPQSNKERYIIYSFLYLVIELILSKCSFFFMIFKDIFFRDFYYQI